MEIQFTFCCTYFAAHQTEKEATRMRVQTCTERCPNEDVCTLHSWAERGMSDALLKGTSMMAAIQNRIPSNNWKNKQKPTTYLRDLLWALLHHSVLVFPINRCETRFNIQYSWHKPHHGLLVRHRNKAVGQPLYGIMDATPICSLVCARAYPCV